MSKTKRQRHTVTGQVQGVGFRPFVYRLATQQNLSGWVRNTPEGVVIELQGPPDGLDSFARRFTEELPPLARIVSAAVDDAEPVENEAGFKILASTAGQGHSVLVSPDTATCADCLAEMRDPADRRYLYPFTNCTNCGPRYTITKSVPYDRPVTTMAPFIMCSACQAEYDDPLDRRFHAQPNACPECGPAVWLEDASGTRLADGDKAMVRLADMLVDGRICAIKGLGGFHLACRADEDGVVAELRRRKDRQHKPLAVMVPDLNAAHQMARVSAAEDEWLAGSQRPIVLLRRRPDAWLSHLISPDTPYVGVMLPYTPLHHALFYHLQKRLENPALVMTSGNARSEPICIGTKEARARLGPLADTVLLHDRDILIRTDDSVLRVLGDETGATMVQYLRRARGFVPSPIFLPQMPDAPQGKKAEPACVLGTGPEMKNTLCLTKGGQAYVSQHIGDLESLQAFEFWDEIRQHLAGLLKVEPELAVRDLHPDYMTSQWAQEQSGLPVQSLQHHFAHVHAVLAEHQLSDPVLGLALDGTGYGPDGTLWGGEALFVDPRTLEHARLGRLAHLRLPGGEAAIRQPWRIALAALHAQGHNTDGPWLPRHQQAHAVVLQMLDKDLNCPVTSSCGRLFDAVAGLTGVCLETTYEGQGAIRLEAIQDLEECQAYDCVFTPGHGDAPGVLDTLSMLSAVAADARGGLGAGRISRRFHLGLVRGLTDMAAALAKERGVNKIALSGGVFLNQTIHLELRAALRRAGFTPLSHLHLPPGDGCISLGQAAWGRLAWCSLRPAR